MQDYFVRYPGAARDAKELDAALVRIRGFEDSSPALSARWLHGYAMRETDGGFGLACVFRADGPGTLGRHAEATRLPPAEILPIVRAWVVRRFAPTMVYLVRRRAAWTNSGALERAVESARRVKYEASCVVVACTLAWLTCATRAATRGSAATAACVPAAPPAPASGLVNARTGFQGAGETTDSAWQRAGGVAPIGKATRTSRSCASSSPSPRPTRI